MMDITDRRFRYFMRLINPQVRLYTEMIVCHAIVRGDRKKLLQFDASEHPVTLQLGGSDVQLMAEAARIGEEFGYDAVDVNCGCPSDRVGSGNFGACLMRQPELVAEIVAAIAKAVKVPVSVKCRIGITGEESQEGLFSFAQGVFAAGATLLTVHARTATLQGIVTSDRRVSPSAGDGPAAGRATPGGLTEVRTAGLSPKENRTIPPLRYDWAYAVKEHFPRHTIEVNGGIKTRSEIAAHLEKVDRVMLGRLAHEDPWFFSDAPAADLSARLAVMERMAEYAARHESADITAARFFHNMLNIFHALPGAKALRRFLSEDGRALSPAAALAKMAMLRV